MNIIIDSNIIDRDFQLTGHSFRVFFNGLSKIGAVLYVPQIVIDEVKNKFDEKLTSNLRELKKLTGEMISLPVAKKKNQELTEKYNAMVCQKFASVNAIIPAYPKTTHQELVQRALLRKKPFSKSGRGYRDALIWEVIISLAKDRDKPIVFITNNTNDFCDSKKQPHPDLIADLKYHKINVDHFEIFADLNTFIEKKIKPTLESLESVRTQLSAGHYPGFNLVEELQGFLDDLVYQDEWESSEIGFPREFENPRISGFYDISNINVVDVRKMSSDELLIEIEVDAECEFDFFITHSNLAILSDDERPYITDYDWNEWSAAAATMKDSFITVSLTLDTKSKKPTSIKINSVIGKNIKDAMKLSS